MNEEPLVSVVIPTHKRPWPVLSRAVDSVLGQDFAPFELIVVDDSPADYDERRQILENLQALAEKDPRVTYLVNGTPLGGSQARNRGIEEARGRYVTFLDDDDEYLPGKLAHQCEYMEQSGCGLSFEDMVLTNTKGRIVDVREYRDIESFDNEYLLRYHLMRHMTGTPTFMVRREELLRIGGFDDVKMGQEFHLMLKAILAGVKIGYLPVCDVRVYKHRAGGITSGRNKISGEKALYEFKKGFFDRLDARAIRFIRFRHQAVMVVAYLRNRMPLRALGAGLLAFAASPGDLLREVPGFFRRIRRKKAER